MKNLFKSMITSKYFIYFSIVVAVMLCLLVPVYAMAYNTFYNNAVRDMENRMDAAVEELENSFFSICELNNVLSSNDLYLLRSFSGNEIQGQTVYSARKVWQQMQAEARHMELADLVYLSFGKNEIVITPYAVYYSNAELAAMGLESRFPNADICFYTVPDYKGAPALEAVSNPLYTNISIAAVYTAQDLQSLFGDLPVTLYLYGIGGDLALCTEGAAAYAPEASVFGSGLQRVMLDGTGCTAIGRSMQSTGLTLGICMPSSYIRELVRPILQIMIGCFVTMAAVGLALSVFMAVYSTRPIRRLVRDTLQKPGDGTRVNELRCLLEMRESYSTSLRDQETRLQEMMETVRQVLRENYFIHLVNNAPAARDNEAAIRDAIPELCRPYRVALLEIRDGAYLDRIRRALTGLGFLTVHSGEGRLVACVPESETERFREAERAVREETDVQIGLSEPVTELFGVYGAYRKLRGSGGKTEPVLSGEKLRMLETCFRSGESIRAETILEGCTVLKTDAALRDGFEQLRALMRRVWPEEDLPFFEDGEGAASQLQALIRLSLVLTGKNEKQLNARGGYKRQVLAYIGENLGDPDMCVDRVAQRFGISGRQVYGIVKDAEGVSFTEYLTQLRMKYAAECLAVQSVPIREIAVSCGYTSLNTFYKAFRRYYGFPPGQYGRTVPS